MPRAPFQVLVIPYRRTDDGLRFALFQRADADMWQWISGGGEDGETPLEAARREALEEGGIANSDAMIPLSAVASIPIEHISERAHWPAELHVIPEYSFAIELQTDAITLCDEHRCFEWLDYDEAHRRARWDSNRVALWELRRRLSQEYSYPVAHNSH